MAQQDAEDDADRQLTQAWQIEALHRHKKLPSLRTLLQKNKRRKQTVDEQRAMLETLSGQYGGKLRKAGTGGR